MALFDFLKNKHKAEKIKEAGLKKNTEKQTKKDKMEESPEISFKGGGAKASRILKRPVITEKATYLSGNNKYVFEVYDNANKPEIKKAIEKLYDVKVLTVNVLNMSGKKRRIGRSIGKQSGFKKAIITLPKGQKIDILAQ